MIRKLCLPLFLFLVFVPTCSWAGASLERGLSAAKQEQWEIATEAFIDAWEETPLSPMVLYNLGLSYAKSGNALPAIAWFEAYLASDPDAPNKAQIRSTIAQMEVKTELAMNDLFEKNLAMIKEAPFEESYAWYTGKHWEASRLVYALLSSGKLKRAKEILALSKVYAQKVGGPVYDDAKFIHTDDDIQNLYARNLSANGNLLEALEHTEDDYYLGTVYTSILKEYFATGAEIQQALKASDEYETSAIAYAARNLWLKGDVEGLTYLAEWLEDKSYKYFPAMAEVAQGLLGLGYEDDAAAFAKKLPKTWDGPAARYATRLLYEQPDIGFLNCYARGEPDIDTLWRMLKVRHFALKGNSEKAKSHTEIPVGRRRAHSKDITADMKADHAWSRAFEQYAAKNINEAKAIMSQEKQDVTSFLIMTLRNAAIRDPQYAREIALVMEPAYLGPFILFEASKQARLADDESLADSLLSEASKRASVLGAKNKISFSNGQLKDWTELGILYSQNDIVSDFSGAIRLISDGGVPSYEPLRINPPFVSDDHYYDCPPENPGEIVEMATAVPSEPITSLTHVSDAAVYLGEGLLQTRAMRQRHSRTWSSYLRHPR